MSEQWKVSDEELHKVVGHWAQVPIGLSVNVPQWVTETFVKAWLMEQDKRIKAERQISHFGKVIEIQRKELEKLRAVYRRLTNQIDNLAEKAGNDE